MTSLRRYGCLMIASLLATAGGCSNDPSAPGTKQVEIVNGLLARLTIKVDGHAVTAVPSGSSSAPTNLVFQVLSTARVLTYELEPELNSNGSPIPADFSGQTLTLPDHDVSLQISNVVRGTTYFFPILVGPSAADLKARFGTDTVSFDIGVGTSRNCLVTAVGSNARLELGYYALTPQTELRICAGSSCQPSRLRGTWSSSSLDDTEQTTGGLVISY